MRNIQPIPSTVRSTSQKTVYRFVVIGIVFLASVFRIILYGDPTLSIAGNDTASYIASSKSPLFSSEIMTGRRPLTTNLLYKIFEPGEDQILVNGSIATAKRIVQPGFSGMVVTQLIFSLMGWGLLALSISENIKNPLMKIMSALVIVLFAFTPQMADWDSILMSESFTFSLFALQLAILIRLAFLIYKDPNAKVLVYLILWAITYFLWTFLRDTHIFASVISMGMIGILFLSTRYRKNKYLYGTVIFLAVITAIGLITSGNSTRSLVQMTNIYRDDLLGSPASVSTLRELGMPEPDSVEYQSWFQENSTKTLIKYMLIHPGYPIIKIARDFPNAFTEIKQTYFKAPEQGQTREKLMTLGNALHPETATPFLLDLLLSCGLLLLAINNTNETSRPWAWLGAWLMLTAGITLIPTILGDTWALNRHALFSTTVYRLFMWTFSVVIMDIAIGQNTTADKPSIS